MLFSIITVCLNSHRTISRTIESVLNQSFKNYEYIIIDGGSTDGTVDLIKSYEPMFEGRMHWSSESDRGIYDAFNKGCRDTTGIYKWIVNSDDFIEPDALKTISEIVSKYDLSNLPVISGAVKFIYRNGKNRYISYTKESAASAFSIGDIGIAHPATLVPGSVYEKVGLYDDRYRIMADMDWFRRAYAHGCHFVWIPDVLSNMTEGGVSTELNLSWLASDRWLYTCKFYEGTSIRISAFTKWMFLHLKGCLKSWLIKKAIIRID